MNAQRLAALARSMFGMRWLAPVAAAGLALAVAGCGSTVGTGIQPQTAAAPSALPTIGSGSNKVALLLPLSGNSAAVGRELRNAAELALSDIPGADIQLIPLDTQGTAAGARNAAQQAVTGGARLIIGPLFAGSVGGAASVARPAGVPIVAFSSDASVAAPGVYLLSFLAEADIERVVAYSARSGRRSFAALLPEDAYGAVAEAALQQAAVRSGGRVATIARYPDAAAVGSAVRQIASVTTGESATADALLVPDAGNLAAIGPALADAGIGRPRVQILGSGQWNDPQIWSNPAANGVWYAAPEPQGFERFSAKYRSRFGATPPRRATLAYDAVTLAAALSRIGGAAGFNDQMLTNPDGFAGIDGVFRFRGDGRIERALAVLEIRGGSVTVVDPAPRMIGAGG